MKNTNFYTNSLLKYTSTSKFNRFEQRCLRISVIIIKAITPILYHENPPCMLESTSCEVTFFSACLLEVPCFSKNETAAHVTFLRNLASGKKITFGTLADTLHIYTFILYKALHLQKYTFYSIYKQYFNLSRFVTLSLKTLKAVNQPVKNEI